MSDLVGNPEDRFSRVAAQIIQHKVVHPGVLFRIPVVQQDKVVLSFSIFSFLIPTYNIFFHVVY